MIYLRGLIVLKQRWREYGRFLAMGIAMDSDDHAVEPFPDQSKQPAWVESIQ